MGKKPRPKPKRLAEKLLTIRNALGLSQSEMLKRLEAEDQIDYTAISKYEVGRNEPSLMLLLQYARAAGVHMEDLVDDELDLPNKLPGPVKYRGIKSASNIRSKKR
ncbi:MAG TPA: helix-turn-helix transcriptional regulator [Pyrinomonadaceae bacterium]|jgi:transcriptional regulator with XRE-family HTH domain